MFSPSHWGRVNLGCETSWFSSLISNDLRSDGFNNAGLSFCELITETLFKTNRISILTEFIPLWGSSQMTSQLEQNDKEISVSSFDKQWTVLFI